MNKEQLTYAQLIQLDADIQKLQEFNGAIIFFLGDKISRFYNLNNQRINIAKKHIKALLVKYVEQDDAGKLKTIAKADGSEEYVWKTAGSYRDYTKECDEFLQVTIDVFH